MPSKTTTARNVYDFDNTVYRGDSSVHFYLFCARKYPWLLLDLPAVGGWFIGMWLGRVDMTRVKQRLHRYLTRLPDVSALVASFWASHEQNLKPWYLLQKRADDVIISASPEFLLTPVCERLGVTLLASRVDPHTGVYTGLNCHDTEKVRRLDEALPDCVIADFYSDSLADTPLALRAKRAFLVRGDARLPWPRQS